MQTGLFERNHELGRIDALLALAQAGSGDMLLITGPAGIGKSVLLGVARERARLAGRGGRVGWGRGVGGGVFFVGGRRGFWAIVLGVREKGGGGLMFCVG